MDRAVQVRGGALDDVVDDRGVGDEDRRSQKTLSAAATATIGQCRRQEKPLGRSFFFREDEEERGPGD
jgi:hypothetical protein